MLIGESFIGEGVNAAHVNVILGSREGPTGTAWATALASPTPGHIPFMVVLQPGLPVKPMTLFINKSTITDDTQATLTWGAAQAGVAGGVAARMLDGTLPPAAADDWCVIAAVWVNPSANDAAAVFENNREATYRAIEAALAGTPSLVDVATAAKRPFNAYFEP
jgi:5,6,7,8-tetrahydromethanopterin hydro-lyase